MDNLKKEQYNDIPVHFCRDCLSLKIKTVVVSSDLDYCDECGSTNIGEAHIEEWRTLYREKYGFDYLDKDIIYGREKSKTQL